MREKIRRNRRQRGQGMTEYIIIVAVVAVLSIAVVTQFGNRLRALYYNAMRGNQPAAQTEMDPSAVNRTLGELEGGSES